MSPNRGALYIGLVNLAAIIALGAFVILSFAKKEGPDPAPSKTREMAAMLEARGLYGPALAKLEQYRQSAGLAADKEARLLFRMGKMAQDKLGDHEEAAMYYTLATALGPGAEWKAEADKRTVVCLDKSGRKRESRALLRQVTGDSEKDGRGEAGQTPAGPVVAVVDGESVYWSSLSKIEAIRRKSEGGFTLEDRKNLVQEYVMKRVLADEAMSSGLEDGPEMKFVLDLCREEALAAAYVNSKTAGRDDEQTLQKLWQEASDLHEVEIFYDAVPAP